MDLIEIVETSHLPSHLPHSALLAGYRARVHLGDGCRNPYNPRAEAAAAAWRHGFELAHRDIKTRPHTGVF
jgi:hypothetical protein